MSRIYASNFDPQYDEVTGFAGITGIDDWREDLTNVYPQALPVQPLSAAQRSNIGYRLQLLEFDTAVLLLDFETLGQPYSALHITVSKMKIQQYCTLACSILEAIGSHIYRVIREAEGQPVPANRTIGTNTWSQALASEVGQRLNLDDIHREALLTDIRFLIEWRHRIHMDRIGADEALIFNQIDYPNVFAPSYRTFRRIMLAFIPTWRESCLNECL